MGVRKIESALRPLRYYEFMAVLQREVDRYRSDAAAAKALGVSRSHLSRVLRDQKPVTDRLAERLGYKLEALFVPYDEPPKEGR
jgi:transcriptional regulator with XRE-family HTH domain